MPESLGYAPRRWSCGGLGMSEGAQGLRRRSGRVTITARPVGRRISREYPGFDLGGRVRVSPSVLPGARVQPGDPTLFVLAGDGFDGDHVRKGYDVYRSAPKYE